MDLRELLRGALAAADDLAFRGGWTRSAFRFGDLSIAVRLDGAAQVRHLLPMIMARAVACQQSIALLDVIGGVFSGQDPLLPPVGARGRTVLRANDDLYYLWLNEAGGYLTAIDRRSAHGIVWFPTPERIASWHVARPFLHAIRGFSRDTPWTPVHAASVARNGKAVLIVGQSGAGKTSTAIGCALQGWDYLGDDAVIVRADPARVGSLYSSARLRADTFDRYPEAMKACLGVSDDAGEEKAEVDMALISPLSVSEAEISAIVLPQPTDWTEFRLEPMNRSQAVRRLMEAARQSMLGDEAASFAKLTALVAEVPAFALAPCSDPAKLSDGLARLVEDKDI